MIKIEKNECGLWGGKDENGNVLIPYIYDEITQFDDKYYCRMWKDYDWFDKAGKGLSCSRSRKFWLTQDGPDEMRKNRVVEDINSRKGLDNVPLESENGVYVKYANGKFGVLDKDKSEILPCVYDEVYRWEDCEVIQARKGLQHLYFDMSGNPILTKHRNGPVDDWLSPYFNGEQQNDVALMTMEFVEDCYDEQCCVCYDRPTRLDRMLRQDIEGRMRANCEFRRFPSDAFYRFNGWDTYIYRAYIAHGKSSNPMGDCVRQLHDMCCYSSSWFYLDKVLTNSKTKLSDDELDLLQYAANDCSSGGETIIGYGIDDELEDGEVKVFHVEYFSDHWPTEEEWEQEPTFNSLYNCLNPLDDDWKQTKSLLEAHQDLSSFALLAHLADRASMVYRKKEMQFYLNAIRWGLKHGWNPNEPCSGKTALEHTRENLSHFKQQKDCPKYKIEYTDKIMRLLLKHDATTLQEYRMRNPFYRQADYREMD